MNCWTILNIEPTTDERQIRRAYAKILKTIDQDQEPERFIALRAALEQAQSWAAWHQADDEDDDPALDEASHASEPDRSNEQPAILLMQTPHVSMVWHPPQIEIEASTWQTQPTPEPPPLPPIEPLEPPSPEPSWTTRVEEIRQRMWADEWNGRLLMDLRRLLHEMTEQPLWVHMEVYETLSYPLAWADEEQDITHFLILFFQVFDIERLSHSQAEDHELKLYQRYQQVKIQQEFWQDRPVQYESHLKFIVDHEHINVYKMWQLYRSSHPWILRLRQKNWNLPSDIPLERLSNWQLLQLFPFSGLSVGLMVVYGLLLFYFLTLYVDPDVEDEKILVYLILSAVLSVVWVGGWCLRVYAYWLAQDDVHQRPRWFLYVLLLSALVYLSVLFDAADQWVEVTAALGWTIGVLFWIGYYVMKPSSVSIFAWLHRISLGQMTGVLMVVTVLVLMSGLVALGGVWFHEPMGQDVWRSEASSILMMSLPIGLLFYRDAIWSDLKAGWQHQKHNSQKKWLIALSICGLGALFPLCFSEHMWSVVGWLGLMLMTIRIPSKIMAYMIKYGFYAVAVALCLKGENSAWFAIPIIVYTLFQVYSDFKLEGQPKAA